VVRIFWAVLVAWLAIGVLAAGQRHYFGSSSANCSGAGTIVVNLLFGPANYLGANPKLTCS
jgi:hypothetical protein